MKTWFKLLLALLVILLITLVVLWGGKQETEVLTEEPATNTPITATTSVNTVIKVVSPDADALAVSPLTVTGIARGNWYFEASFPVRILDANGKELGVVAAQAQGDWMTTEFVPFSATLSFATSTTATGTLRLEKDNPSGLPEFDAHIEIPIRFK